MKKNWIKYVILLCLIATQNVYSQDMLVPGEEITDDGITDEIIAGESAANIDITYKAIEAYFHTEQNRSERFVWNVSGIGGLELNEMFLFNAGFNFGISGYIWNIKSFAYADVSPFTQKYAEPLSFSLKWLYTGLIEYEEHIHSIIPMISYGTDTLGVSIGVNFRFSSYFSEPAQFEPIFTYLLYWNIVNNKDLRLGINWGTYGDFHARNMGAMALGIDLDMRINRYWTVINKIELLQSGQDGFSANFYGLSWRGGFRLSW